MLRINIIAIGKKHDPLLVDAIDHFQRRMAHSAVVTWDIIPPSDIDSESEKLIKRAGNSTVVLLDENGERYSSEDFSQLLQRAKNQSAKQLSFIIGGAYGVNDAVVSRADISMSLSTMVFPHQLVRLILMEQLYRGFDILAGGKYHHS